MHSGAIIRSICSIGHQDSFLKDNIWSYLTPLSTDSPLISPDYKTYVSASLLRRSSPILKMTLACTQICQQAVQEDFDAICVGTSLGCLQHTEQFLQTYITNSQSLISPTAFIQSTHNTMAGMIALSLANHSYNMTHSQENLSFEMALLDALLAVEEGKKNVLLGAADQAIDFLDNLRSEKHRYPFTSGATFMVLQQEGQGKKILDCVCYFSVDKEQTRQLILQFLDKNTVLPANIDLVLFSGEIDLDLNRKIGGKCLNIEQYTGLYYTSSAFAVHLANDYMLDRNKYSLIVNKQAENKLGLILVGNA